MPYNVYYLLEMEKNIDNKKLIIGLRKGDYHAYETLFMKYYGQFVAFTDSIIQNREAAKDIVQEQFMKVWIHRDKLDENKSIKNFLYVLTKRAILNYIRDFKSGTCINDSLNEIIEYNVTADKITEAEELKKIMNQQIEKLPKQRKKVFMMSRENGMSNQEIAEQLKISVRTVERHLSLALSQIKNNILS